MKLCECGCGQPTRISNKTNKKSSCRAASTKDFTQTFSQRFTG